MHAVFERAAGKQIQALRARLLPQIITEFAVHRAIDLLRVGECKWRRLHIGGRDQSRQSVAGQSEEFQLTGSQQRQWIGNSFGLAAVRQNPHLHASASLHRNCIPHLR